MRAVVQRVQEAQVQVAGEITGKIGPGLLVLVAASTSDTFAEGSRLADRIFGIRIFADEAGKMNLSLSDAGLSEILVVSQFTLYGDALKSRRPSFVGSAPYDHAEQLYEAFVADLRSLGATVQTGIFGAMMSVASVNDGPVTILIDL